VTIVVTPKLPFGVTVQLEEGSPTVPLVGPVKINAVATEPDVAIKLIGVPLFVKLLLFVIEIEVVPAVVGV
jgi:hypothetical protein